MIKKVKSSIIKIYYTYPIEAIIWIAGLLYLVFLNPVLENHFSLCLFHRVGLDFCPGCGLGRSVSYLLHGDLGSSFQAHPLGIFAFILIVYRIFKQIFNFISNFWIKKINHG